MRKDGEGRKGEEDQRPFRFRGRRLIQLGSSRVPRAKRGQFSGHANDRTQARRHKQ